MPSTQIQNYEKAVKIIAERNPELIATATKQLAEVTYETRRYGQKAWFCWARHPVLGSLGDPCHSSRFPKALALFELVRKADGVLAMLSLKCATA